MYNFDSTITEPDLVSGLGTAAVVLVLLLALVVIALLVVLIIANCKMFTKAGEKWWKGLIPLYNSWIETKIAGLAWYWFPIYVVVLALASVKAYETVAGTLLALVGFNYSRNIAKKFGKSDAFALLLAFIPFIGFPILAFGNAQYNKQAEVDKNGIFSTKDFN